MTQHSDDDQRMIRLQQGDSRAFDELVTEWQGPLFGFFLRNTRDRTLSEDLVQETLLRLYRAAWDYLPTGQFRGWLFRIARNLVIDHTRRAYRDALVRRVHIKSDSADSSTTDILSLLPAEIVSPADRASQSELGDMVNDLLNELPEEQRETFHLHHFNSLTLSEIADAMHTTLPTAKSRLRLAKEKLKYQLSCRGFSEGTTSKMT
ncbi:MAG: sigma-70 family RNA polymerase sigma factor [Fuerstiella sp.]|nr:sigma-70 family RNA polymerase sigma factor [Fuerstiella sp.]